MAERRWENKKWFQVIIFKWSYFIFLHFCVHAISSREKVKMFGHNVVFELAYFQAAIVGIKC